jgi:hypothetical protein
MAGSLTLAKGGICKKCVEIVDYFKRALCLMRKAFFYDLTLLQLIAILS